MASPQYWIVKSEPSVYPYRQLEKDGRTEWSGVRNFEARNNLRAMKPGDLLLYYHSNEGKELVAVAKVLSGPQPDSTAKAEDWTSVMIGPVARLEKPVTLAQMKGLAALKDLALIRRSRLSVTPVTPVEFREILKLSETSPKALKAS
jgi:predicted RNA-binding protein with PUA-like domain